MEIGKVSEAILKRSVFKPLKVKRQEVLLLPNIGEDCSAIALNGDEIMVMTTDPITATTTNLGYYAVHITLNDIASAGAEPIGIMLTLLLPDQYSEKSLKELMASIGEECEKYGVQVLGGHTEVTDAVTRPIISVTGVGKVHKDRLIATSTGKVGDAIVMSKWAGVEGTAIIASERQDELAKRFNKDFVDQANGFQSLLSVLEEGKIGGALQVNAMHDITEGGVYGALWEIAAACGLGIEVNLEDIPVNQITIELCELYDLNPYKLISSGSMLFATSDGPGLVEALNQAGIKGSIIGKLTEGSSRVVIKEDGVMNLKPAERDEIYKLFN